MGKRDNSWIDVMWSISFCIPNAVILALRSINGDRINARMILASVCVLLWALRLSLYIWARHKSEDYRYKQMREGWEAVSNAYYYFASYTFVFFLQGILSIVNNSSLLFINIFSD